MRQREDLMAEFSPHRSLATMHLWTYLKDRPQGAGMKRYWDMIEIAVRHLRRLGGRGGQAAALQSSRQRTRPRSTPRRETQCQSAGGGSPPGGGICRRQASGIRIRAGCRRPGLRQAGLEGAAATFPFGRTTSYGAVAKTIGHPNAARAVGAANGANPIALIVPCHRVIGSDGSLTGFGGGLPLEAQAVGA